MQLTPEDHAKLETKQLANIIRKLNSGKTLTAREEAILARARAQPAAGVQTPGLAPLASAYATSWDDLAQALGVSRKSLQNWRSRPELVGKYPTPRADGRHDVAAWSRFMVEHRLARADEDVDPDDLPSGAKLRTVTDWKMQREKLLCTKLEREIDKDDGKLLVAADLEVPLGATFAAIQTKLAQYPSRVARFVTGLRDEQEVEERLRDEMDADLSDLHAARYVHITVGEILADLPFDQESTRLLELVTFAGQDQATLLELIARVAVEALRRIGHGAIRSAMQQHGGSVELVPDAITGQVRDEAAVQSATLRAEPPLPATSPAREATAASAEPPPPAAPAQKPRTLQKAAAPQKAKRGRPKKARPQPASAPAEVEGAILASAG